MFGLVGWVFSIFCIFCIFGIFCIISIFCMIIILITSKISKSLPFFEFRKLRVFNNLIKKCRA